MTERRARQLEHDWLHDGRLYSGIKDYHEKTKGWRPGPGSPAEFADWPCRQVNALLGSTVKDGPLRIARLQALLRGGTIIHTDYSGMCGPEMALRMQGRALEEFGIQLPNPYITLWRACDTDTVRSLVKNMRSIIKLNWEDRLKPNHV